MTPAESHKIKVSAINVMLQHINELPIETLADLDSVYEARVAEGILEEVTADVLSEGWDFNTDKDWVFMPDNTGQINIPVNVLDITADNNNVLMRDWSLYDKTRKTFRFDKPQACTVIWNVEFNALTHPLRKYINIRAARIFQIRMIGDREGYGFSEKEEIEARNAAKVSDDRTGGFSMASGIASYLDTSSI